MPMTPENRAIYEAKRSRDRWQRRARQETAKLSVTLRRVAETEEVVAKLEAEKRERLEIQGGTCTSLSTS